MRQIIASLALLFIMFTSLHATEATTEKNDQNCTVEKCKMKQSDDANCTLKNCNFKKCQTMSKKDCMTKQTKKCPRDGNQTSNDTMPKWSPTQDGNATMKLPSCCQNKQKAEAPEEKPMKCNQGKCGAGKCGGK